MSIYLKRLETLSSNLKHGHTAILFSGNAPKSTADSHYGFRPDKNFFYLTGLRREGFILAVSSSNEVTLFIEKPDYDIEKWVGRKLTKEQATKISGITDIKYLGEFETWFANRVYSGKLRKLHLDLERMRWNDPTSEVECFAHEITKKYPALRLKSLHPLMMDMRMYKSNEELDEMRKAIDLTHQGFLGVMKAAKPGVYEYELEAEFAYRIRKGGADRTSFETIVASGGDGVILHYVSNSKPVEDGNLVLLDFGAQYREYAADISRTIPVNGKYSERQKVFYNIVLKAQEDVLSIMKPGTPFEALNKKCQESIANSLIEIGLIQSADELNRYYYHGCSHYLGLDVHDIGRRDIELKPGMVLTLEPGLYVAEEGIGIRIEDDILITEDGYENLSVAIPKSVEDIEAYMAQCREHKCCRG